MNGREVTVKVASVCVAAACTLALVPGSASAATALRSDRRGDAPKSIDITRTTYRHAPARVSVKIRARALDGPGRAELAISKFTIFEAGYVARVKKKANGRVSKRLFYFNHFRLVPRSCKVSGVWNERRSTVRISVPRRCLKHHRKNRLYVAAMTVHGKKFDKARAVRRLKRG